MTTPMVFPPNAKIRIHVAPDATVSSHVEGVQGPSCEALLDKLLRDLFDEVVEEGHTADFDRKVIGRVLVEATQ